MAEKRPPFWTPDRINGVIVGETGIALAVFGAIELLKAMSIGFVSLPGMLAVAGIGMGYYFLSFGFNLFRRKKK